MIIEKQPTRYAYDTEHDSYVPIEYTYILTDETIDGFTEIAIRDPDYDEYVSDPRYQIVRNDTPDPQAETYDCLGKIVRDIVYAVRDGWVVDTL